jgi:hypothetical protein
VGCVTSANFVVLVNGSMTKFFKSYRGLRKGCSLSPLVFLLVVEGFNRMMKKASSKGKFYGIKVAKGVAITHLLFVDDAVILGVGFVEEWNVLKQLLSIFCQASGMEINYQKPCFLYNNIEVELLVRLDEIFGIPIANIDHGMKYLGFLLKPNDYRVSDWTWIL